MIEDKFYEWTPAHMLEVRIAEPDDFLKIKETLSRIGISSTKEVNTLYQSCHILHKQGRYFIVHFKELFLLDGKPSNLMYSDMIRRNTIAHLLSDWGLVDIINDSGTKFEVTDLKNIKIVKHADKGQWELKAKYSIGAHKGANS